MLKQVFVLTAMAVAATGPALAATTTITDTTATVKAAVNDAGNFDAGSGEGSLGLSYMGREYINWGTHSSWYVFDAGGPTATAWSATGSNPFSSTTYPAGPSATTTVASGGWGFTQTTFASSPNSISVTVQFKNNTGSDVVGAKYSVGFDPDQDVPNGTFATANTILAATGTNAAVSALGIFGGYGIVLQNTTSAGAFAVQSYISPGNCCSPIAPGTIFAAGQLTGYSTYADEGIALAYDLGTIKAGQTVSFGYTYTMSLVPEPETYALMLAGLAAVGFVAARRRV